MSHIVHGADSHIVTEHEPGRFGGQDVAFVAIVLTAQQPAHPRPVDLAPNL